MIATLFHFPAVYPAQFVDYVRFVVVAPAVAGLVSAVDPAVTVVDPVAEPALAAAGLVVVIAPAVAV